MFVDHIRKRKNVFEMLWINSSSWSSPEELLLHYFLTNKIINTKNSLHTPTHKIHSCKAIKVKERRRTEMTLRIWWSKTIHKEYYTRRFEKRAAANIFTYFWILELTIMGSKISALLAIWKDLVGLAKSKSSKWIFSE